MPGPGCAPCWQWKPSAGLTAPARLKPRSATFYRAAAMTLRYWFRRSAVTGRLKMGSIGSWMSRSARMTAASGIERQLAIWPSCARSPSTSWAVAEHPGSACGPVASRPPGMTSTCWLYWLDDFMRRPCTVSDLEKRGIGLRSLTEVIDTTTSGGRLILHVFGALGQFERDLIRERTQAGLTAAAARGRKGGRKP